MTGPVSKANWAYRIAYAFEIEKPTSVRRCWIVLRILAMLAVLLPNLYLYQVWIMVATIVGGFVVAYAAIAIVCAAVAIALFGIWFAIVIGSERASAYVLALRPVRIVTTWTRTRFDRLCPVNQVV
jgi:hypothetical protein